jgi:hypothetical protein
MYRNFLFLLAVLGASAAAAQTPLTRGQAIERALANNLGVRISRLQAESADLNNVWGAAGALPTVGITSSLSTAVSDQTRNPTSFIQARLGSQSFNAVNSLRLLGRWMRMFTIPNQSSVAKAYAEFDEAGRMKPSTYYDRIVDVCEELVRFTVLLRPHNAQLVDRYSERVEADRPVGGTDGILKSI